MPRGRGRPRKPRLSRIDAAIDAMAPFGFPEAKVRKAVKQLLKEYGGDEGWPFIEEYSYKELVEALLRDVEQNNQENVAENGNELMDKSFEDERTPSTSTRVSDTLQDEIPDNNVPPDVTITTGVVTESTCPEVVTNVLVIYDEVAKTVIPSEDGKGWKDILADQTSAQNYKDTAKIVCKADEDDLLTETNPERNIVCKADEDDLMTETNPERNIVCKADEEDLMTETNPERNIVCKADEDDLMTEMNPERNIVCKAEEDDLRTKTNPERNIVCKADEDDLMTGTNPERNIVCKADEDDLKTETNPKRNSAIPTSPSVTNLSSPPPPTKYLPTPRRPQCCGWIESDEEIDDIVYLRPAPAVVKSRATPCPELSKIPTAGTQYDRKRKSR